MVTVTCNGCFDGIHPGHLFFLGFCRGKGNRLIVGINTDEYIKRNKRLEPLFCEDDRRAALMGLGFIDKVLLFEEDTPEEFIRGVRPDIHCTGEEYGYDCPESAVCKEIGVILSLVPRTTLWATSSLDDATMVGVREMMKELIGR